MGSQKFGKELIAWHDLHGRHFLPWNQTQNAYHIWLSEVILQQTRVEQGLPYYKKFVELYPTVEDLATAPLDQVLKLWEGLGYYSRARNLHKAAQHIVEYHQGQLPASRSALLQIPGIGPYTSAAIASFGFGLPHAVVDGNVTRIVSRIANIRGEVDRSAVKKQIEEEATNLLGDHSSAHFNRAMMDLGSKICLPRKPQCTICPVADYCQAKANGDPESLPIKKPKKAKQRLTFQLLATASDMGMLKTVQRPPKGIWGGLFFLPEAKSAKGIKSAGTIRHQLSHKDVHMELFYRDNEDHKTLSLAINAALSNKAFPVPVKKLLEDLEQELKLDV